MGPHSDLSRTPSGRAYSSLWCIWTSWWYPNMTPNHEIGYLRHIARIHGFGHICIPSNRCVMCYEMPYHMIRRYGHANTMTCSSTVHVLLGTTIHLYVRTLDTRMHVLYMWWYIYTECIDLPCMLTYIHRVWIRRHSAILYTTWY